MIDYATGTTGAFAISAALYQTLRTGKGQYIDMAMLDVALILQASHLVDHFHNGHKTKRAGNKMRFPESSMQQASDGLVQLAASNKRQHRRFYAAIGEAGEAERCNLDERYARYDEKQAMIASKLKEKTAQEWEDYFQSKHVPATRVRELHEALKDPQLKHRTLLHRHENVPGVGKPVTVPLTAFKFQHDGARVDSPPRAARRAHGRDPEVSRLLGGGNRGAAAKRAAPRERLSVREERSCREGRSSPRSDCSRHGTLERARRTEIGTLSG